jgi:hypothetical protein
MDMFYTSFQLSAVNLDLILEFYGYIMGTNPSLSRDFPLDFCSYHALKYTHF